MNQASWLQVCKSFTESCLIWQGTINMTVRSDNIKWHFLVKSNWLKTGFINSRSSPLVLVIMVLFIIKQLQPGWLTYFNPFPRTAAQMNTPAWSSIYFLLQLTPVQINNIMVMFGNSSPSPAPLALNETKCLSVCRFLWSAVQCLRRLPGAFSRCEAFCLHLLFVFQEVSPLAEIFHLPGKMKKKKKHD